MGVGVKRVYALYEHGVTHAGNAAAADRAHVGPKALGDEGVDVQLSRIVELRGFAAQHGRGLTIVVLAEGAAVESAVGLAVGNGALLQVVAIDTHQYRARFLGDVQLVVAALVGHRRLALIVVG